MISHEELPDDEDAFVDLTSALTQRVLAMVLSSGLCGRKA